MVRFVVALAFIGLTACSVPGLGNGACRVQIDWVDFVQVGQTQFVARVGNPPALHETDLGPAVMTVKFKVEGNICDPDYKPKDGDAAFLEVGTPVYQVKGYAPSELLAAFRNGEVVAYHAFKPAQ
jgi:hypothetical protein